MTAAAPDEDRWTRADRIFEAALDLPAGERSAYVRAECEGDDELRELVERLLAGAEETTSLLTPGGALAGPLAAELSEELQQEDGDGAPSEGMPLGRYRILHELGRGGMAVVYLAERADGQFEQKVAVKRIKRGIDTDEVIQRFDQERQILALARHPNIARLLDGGVDDTGRPYFVMEYVEGRPIDHYCDEEMLTVRQRLVLFLQVARAVEYAHRNLVVHRDIKPTNILVSDGQVKLLDFGIAKLLSPDAGPGESPLTRSYARVMTPLYASPEQIQGAPITTASDVYQLGLLLYLLLAGRWPYRLQGGEAAQVIEAIAREEPTRPSVALERTGTHAAPTDETAAEPEEIGAARGTTAGRLRRQLAGDLDNIVLMALRKEPERRYASVGRLIQDIERYLDGEPVSARPDTVLYRTGKFVRRNAPSVATAAAALVLLVTLAVFYTVQLRQERDAARLAAAEATQVSQFLRGLFEVSAPTRSRGEQVTARQLLDRGASRIEEELARQPELQASMMTLMGSVYGELALYQEAEPLLERAVEIRRTRPGRHYLDLADSLYGLARVFEEEERIDEAEALYREAWDLREAALGPDDPQVGRALNGLGRVAEIQGELDASREYQEQALRVLEAALGPNDPDVGLVLKDLGYVLAQQREWQPARERLERALTILEESLEPDHPHIADARVTLADVLRYTGDVDGARRQFEQALGILERAYGPDHPRLASALDRFGSFLRQIEPESAIEMHERALSIYRAALGDDHSSVGAVLNNLGRALWWGQHHEEALARFEESARVFETSLGPDHVHLATALKNTAELLEVMGDYRAAIPIQERVLGIRTRVYGAEHSLLNPPLYRLGALHLALGDAGTAEGYLRRALELGTDSGPLRYPEILWPRIDLARAVALEGRYEEAVGLLEQTLADEPDVQSELKALEALAEVYGRWGKSSQATEYRKAAEALRVKMESS